MPKTWKKIIISDFSKMYDFFAAMKTHTHIQ